MYRFSEYLRICREKSDLQQLELVEALRKVDSFFKDLDVTTLNKWENEVVKPSLNKQTAILRYFSNRSGQIFPYLDTGAFDSENGLAAKVFTKFVGRHKMVASFPSSQMDFNLCKIDQAKASHSFLKAVEQNLISVENLYSYQLAKDQHQKLLEHAGNYFAVCEYQDDYFGHFAALKLLPDAYEQIVSAQKTIEQLTDADFAGENDVGTQLIFGFYSVGDLAASLMWVDFYLYLIRHQKVIQNVAVKVVTSEGETIAQNLNMELVAENLMNGKNIKFYQGSISQILLTDTIVRMLFNQESCPT